MTTGIEFAATMSYWQPGEQRERERAAQRAALAAEARGSTRRRSLVPRVAGALGLF